MSAQPKHTALLLTFYWPPSGGPGVHRWLRFSRFFHENDWKLHVYAPEDAAWPMMDPALEKEVAPEVTVIRRKIFEPHKLIGKSNNPNKGGGITKQKKSSWLQELIIWTRGNIFIPDARVFWIKPSIRFLKRYLQEHPEIDTLISSGPPHSMHLIARALKKQFPQLKWVADFRDPWTEIDYYHELRIGKTADRIQKRLEKAVLTEADLVISIGANCAEGLARIGKRPVEIFTNGFIFPQFDPRSVDLDKPFTIAHMGSMSFARNPEVMWQALSELAKENPDFSTDLKVKLVGPVDYEVLERAKHFGLEQFIDQIPLVSHAESITLQRTAQLLLLVANRSGNVKGILTGKFFEYLGAKRPILAIGEHDSDLETVMNETNSGIFVGYDDVSETKAFLINSWQAYRNGNLHSEATNTEQFNSAHITRKLIERLNSI